MSAIPQFSAPQSPFVGPDGRLTFAGNVFLRDLWLRGGGAIASSNTELQTEIDGIQSELGQQSDSSSSSLEASIDAAKQEFRQWPVAAGLLELVVELSKRVEALEQGAVI
jgi:hypothetical protein